jgi:hypothetical protein
MRDELAGAAATVLSQVDRDRPPDPLSTTEVEWLIDLADYIVRARSAVERDGYDREVVVLPTAEAPGRLVGALGALVSGLQAVGADTETVTRIVNKTAWDCVPMMRRRILDVLRAQPGRVTTSAVSVATSIPTTTAGRTLEDLALLDLVADTKEAERSNAHRMWELSELSETCWPRSPETSG